MEQSNKVKLVNAKNEECLINCLLPLAHTLWPYLYNPALISLQLFKPTPIFLQLDSLITKALSY
jgi:hypothetical protein